MKRKTTVLFLLAILFLNSCNTPINNSEDDQNEQITKVEYISDTNLFYYKDEQSYRLFFSFKDRNYVNIAGKAEVTIRIYNLLKELIYSKVVLVTESYFSYWERSDGSALYLASIPIKYSDIKEGILPEGSVTCSIVFDDGRFFNDFNLDIQGLPVKVFNQPLSYYSTTIGNIIGVPAGYYRRNSTQHNYNVLSEFRISQYEISREQFVKVFATDPSDLSKSSSVNDPVQNINWYQAIAFCNKLSILENLQQVYKIDGIDFSVLNLSDIPTTLNENWNDVEVNWSNNGYRLPTELEWRWAAMGAKDFESGIDKLFAGSTGSNDIDDYAWYYNPYTLNKITTSQPIGQKLPNELGLYDMSGNVGEWIWTSYVKYNDGIIDSNSEYGRNGSSILSESKLICGGNWADSSFYCKIATVGTSFWPANKQTPYTGFRVVRN